MPAVLSKEEEKEKEASPPWGILAAVGIAAAVVGGIYLATTGSSAPVEAVAEAQPAERVATAAVAAAPRVSKPAAAAAATASATPPSKAAPAPAAPVELPAAPAAAALPAAPTAPTEDELEAARVEAACNTGKTLSDTATKHFKAQRFDEAIKSWSLALSAYVNDVPPGCDRRQKALGEARVIRWNLSSTHKKLASIAKSCGDVAAHVAAVTEVERLCTEALQDAPRYLRFVERRADYRLMRADLIDDEAASLELIRG